MSVRQRIAHALAANTVGQAITVLSQVLLTPAYFSHWGTALYGEWLLISSIPAYLAMADLGVGTAAGNDMAMQAGAGQWARALATYKGALRVASLASLAAMMLGLGMSWLATQGIWPQTTQISQEVAAWLMMALAMMVSLGFFGTVVSAGFRAIGANATGIMWSNAARLVEALVTSAMLIAGKGPLALCLSLLLVKCVMLLVQLVAFRRMAPQLFEQAASADKQLLRRLLRPSLAFMAMPLGNALSLQGPLMLLGSLSGPESVAIFSAMRTLARVPIQLANALNASVWPEISRAWGLQQLQKIRTIHRKTWALTTAFALSAVLGQVLLGAWLCQLWLGPGHHSAPILNSLALAAALSAIWNVSSVLLVAVNAHVKFSVVYIGVNALALVVSVPAYQALGMPGLLLGQLLPEALMLLWVWPVAMRLSHDHARAFFSNMARL